MPLSDRLSLKALASEHFTWPLPGVLARAETLEVGDGKPVERGTRILVVHLVGEPPLPEELDELYAAAQPGVEVRVRWR